MKKVCVFLVVFFAAAPSRAGAFELIVSTGGNDAGNSCNIPGNPCRTIQHAIDVAADGDTVSVFPGTYYENLNIAKTSASITLVGNSCGIGCTRTGDPDPTQTIIDGGGGGRALTLSGSDSTKSIFVQAFTIRNGFSNADGGGVYISGDTPVTLDFNTITGNTAFLRGGGVFAAPHTTVTLSNNTISGNQATFGGGLGALAEVSSVTLNLSNNTISSNNAATAGGGVYVLSYSDGVLGGVFNLNVFAFNTIEQNQAPDGGGIYAGAYITPTIQWAPDVITNVSIGLNTIQNNTATHSGGGIMFETRSTGTVNGELAVKGSVSFINNITGNSATTSGGGIYARAADDGVVDVDFYDNLITFNSASTGGGFMGTAETGGTGWYDLQRNWISDNGKAPMIASAGGAVYFNGSGGTTNGRMLRNIVLKNKAANMGGGVCVASGNGFTGLFAQNNRVVKNESAQGSGLYFTSGTNGTTQATFTNNTVSGNTGTGGAVTAFANAGTVQVNAANSIFWGNTVGTANIDVTEFTGASVHFYNEYSDVQSTASVPVGRYVDLGGNIGLDPKFVNTATDDYNLQTTSPLVNAGVCEKGTPASRVAPYDDLWGNFRPGPGYPLQCDIGDYEVEHCINGIQDVDEAGLDCGGNRCQPCNCSLGYNATRWCGGAIVSSFADIATAYAGINYPATCEIKSNRMEFQGNHNFTNTASPAGQMTFRLSGGYDCLNTRAPGHTTVIHGTVTIGGHTTIEADRIAIR